MKKISVIMPTFNRACLIPEAVQSVLDQTFKDLEIIVIDDGSTDNTSRLLALYSSKINYVYTKNSGVSSARNLGIHLATGRYIAFIDSDDLWDNEKLSIQNEFLDKNPDAYICYTREKWIRNNTEVSQPDIYAPDDSGCAVENLTRRCYIGASSVLVRKEIFNLYGMFDENMRLCEDMDLWIRIALGGTKFHRIDMPLTIKRMGPWPQLSTSTWGMDRDRIYSFEKILKNNDLTRRHKKLFLSTIRKKSYIIAKGGIKHGNYMLALKYWIKWLRTINYMK